MDKRLLIEKDRKIRCCIVGCGRISKNHIKSICLLNHEYELVAICDNQKERIANVEIFIEESSDCKKYFR